jgi:hypothetical protein
MRLGEGEKEADYGTKKNLKNPPKKIFKKRIISRNLFHTIDMQSLPLPYCSVKVRLSPFYEL